MATTCTATSIPAAQIVGSSSPSCAGTAVVDIQRFKELFLHRQDVFAVQNPNGSYMPIRRPITDDEIAEHLAGFASYGTYVIDPATKQIRLEEGEKLVPQSVKYIVFDLDTYDEDAQEHLCACVEDLLRSVRFATRQCVMYESSGGKGTHVWLFFSAPLPARQVRAWIERDFMPAWIQQPEGIRWPLEVFPKQDAVEEGGFGNLVKLPLGVHAVSGKKSEFLPRQGWASSVDEVVPLDSSLIPVVNPPHRSGDPRTGGAIGQGGHGGPDGPQSPFPCIDAIQNEGVGKGNRDNAMFHLALYCFGHGVPEDLAEEMCLRANENFDPPMSDGDIRDKVRSAYRGRYQSARCGTDWLRDICPGPCKGGWKVLSTQEGDLRTADVGDAVEVEVVRKTREGGRLRLTLGHPDADNTPTMVVRG